MSIQLALIWALSFVLAAIPLHRIVPLVAGWIQDQTRTLDRPRFRAQHVLAVRSVFIVTGLFIAKGALAGWVILNYFRPDWTALVTLGLVLIAHGWSIFSDIESPSTFWVWVGFWLVVSPGLALVFFLVMGGAALALNVFSLALCVSVAVTLYMAAPLSVLPAAAPLVLTLIIGLLSIDDAFRIADDSGDSPTFFGAFRRRP